MKLDIARALADAAAQWRRDRDVLLRIAAVFFFLPSLAFRLFVIAPEPAAEGVEIAPEAAMEQMVGWLAANAHWLLGERVVELFGAAVLLAMLLDPRRLRLGDAMTQAARRFPLFVAAWTIGVAMVALGWLAFILPGLYLIGRTFLIGAVAMAEPERKLTEVIPRAIGLTQGLGWLLLLVSTSLFALSYFGTIFVAELAFAVDGGVIVRALFDIVGAMVSAVVGLAMVLVQASIYRGVAGAVPRQGI